MNEQQPLTGIALAVKQAGAQGLLAKRLGVSQQAVSLWMEQGWVPLRRAGEIEKEFDIPRSSLVNPKIIELVTSRPPPTN